MLRGIRGMRGMKGLRGLRGVALGRREGGQDAVDEETGAERAAQALAGAGPHVTRAHGAAEQVDGRCRGGRRGCLTRGQQAAEPAGVQAGHGQVENGDGEDGGRDGGDGGGDGEGDGGEAGTTARGRRGGERRGSDGRGSRALAERGDGLLWGGGHGNVEARAGQVAAREFGDLGFVLGEQDGRAAGGPLSRRSHAGTYRVNPRWGRRRG